MPRRSTPAISAASVEYVEQSYRRSGSAGMRYSNRSLLRRMAHAMNDCQVGSVTPERIEEWFYGPGGLSETCARSTLGKYRNDLKQFLAWCHRRKWCDSPEFLLGGVSDKSTRAGRERLRLTEPQMWDMVDAAESPRDRALMAFVMHTAVRISEALAVTLYDLRLDAGTVRLRIAKTREEDTVNLAPALERELREWMTAYTARENPPLEARLFPARRRPAVGGSQHVNTDTGWEPLNPMRNPRTVVRALADRAGAVLEDGDGWHTIRRSVARIFFDRASSLGHDAALRMTSALLHHKNTQTTEIYLGLRHERVKRDQVMQAGFLTDPRAVTSLSDYRKASDGTG